LGLGLLGGAGLGLLAGLLSWGAALLLGASPAACLCAGGAAAAAVTGGTLVGLCAALALGRSRLPAGPLARALVPALCVAVYLGLARWLLR
jgi:hypothetical protein